MALLREKLVGAVSAACERELGLSLARIRSAIAPYTRFVRGEQERLTAAAEELKGLGDRLDRLEAEVRAF